MQAPQATVPEALTEGSAQPTTAGEWMARLQAEKAALRQVLSASQEALTGAQETIGQLRVREARLEGLPSEALRASYSTTGTASGSYWSIRTCR
jgi:hypothetical protein